jgi:hypothetical protein
VTRGRAVQATLFIGRLRAGSRKSLRRWRRRTLLDDDLTLAEHDGTRTALALTEPPAQIGQVCVRIYDVPLDWLHARLVIPAIIERYPLTLELRRATDLRPRDPIRHVR